MAIIELPKACAIEQLSSLLDREGALAEAWESLVINVPNGLQIDVSALTFLAAWGLRNTKRHAKLLVRGDKHACERLARMGLDKFLSLGVQGAARPKGEVLVPLHTVLTEGDTVRACQAVIALVEEHFSDAAAFVPALEWAMQEILDNVLRHSESVDAATVYCEYFEAAHRLGVGVCDLGRGMWASLSESMQVSSSGEAIRLAVKRGITRSDELGQGNGLAGVLEIARSNQGAMRIWTGDAVLRVENGKEKGFQVGPTLLGTGIALSLDTRRPVDLQSTWIAGIPYGGIHHAPRSAVAETARAYGVEPNRRPRRVLVSECESTGLRAPATRLRERVSGMLAESDGEIELDFTGVTRASSSFLDELLGRLADRLGAAEFRNRVHVVGMAPLIQSMAHVVIHQRVPAWVPADASWTQVKGSSEARP